MKKIFTILLSFLALAVMANPVDKRTAELVAVHYYSHYAPSAITDYTISNSFSQNSEGTVTFYVINFVSGGFVMVAADDASIPVIGYSHEGAFDAEAINPSAKAWFDNYNSQLIEIKASRLDNSFTRHLWDDILNQNMTRETMDVEPLLTTNWDQGCYYNALCPEESGAGYGSCGRAWTGCVATSMAVLMKYHNWPASGIGTHSYMHTTYGIQSADFASTTYNYAAMPNVVNSANPSVATLMYHAGVSVNMQYDASGSGAFSEDVPFALVNYFKFASTTELKAKADYPVMEDWYALLRADLDAARPVYYAGSSAASGGHAWICDGYRLSDNKFHFNWGWSGSNNGYYAIGSLNPGGINFNDENRAIVGIQPGDNPASWIIQNSGLTAASRGINYIDIVDSNIAWATAYDGDGSASTINEFTRTTDGGSTWVPGDVLGGTTYGIGNISAIDENIAFVSLYNGATAQNNTCGIYKTTDGGVNWVLLPGALQGSASFANNVHFWNELEGMCHGDVKDGYFEIYTTVNGGSTWQRVPQTNITNGTPITGEGGWTSVIDITGNTVMFGTNKGRLFISDDKGMHWRASVTGITPVDNGGINAIAFKDAMHGLVAQTIAPVQVFRTSNGGQTWEAVTPSGSFLTNDLMYVPGTENTYVSTGAATGETGISYSNDGGNTWTMFGGTSSKQFLAGKFLNNTTGFVGGFNENQYNSGMYRMMGELGVVSSDPEITVTPESISATVEAGEVISNPLSISNAGNESLTWSIVIDPGTATWLSVNQASGTTTAGASTELTVEMDATELTTGIYNATLVINNNSGANPVVNVPVQLTVEAGSTPYDILDFEALTDFSLTFGNWTGLDVDGGATYPIQDVTFPHSGEPMSFITFNPALTTPPLTGMTAHGGDRLGACFASTPPTVNNDYMISPKITLGENPVLGFWVKSYTDQYGLETYNIGVSTTDMNPASFATIAGPIDAPADAWTFVTYDLSDYEGQETYVAIQCVSNDRFIFLIDDVEITFISGIEKPETGTFNIYPNPASDILNVVGDCHMEMIRLINLSGQVVFESAVKGNDYSIETKGMPSGFYLLNITTERGTTTRKISIR
ncbi:MAG: C10 family peptidase [Lentimicrobium sp.]|jgi:hypothetical protein|nr:C10 family peptidase [Lentimicrobium sp.]